MPTPPLKASPRERRDLYHILMPTPFRTLRRILTVAAPLGLVTLLGAACSGESCSAQCVGPLPTGTDAPSGVMPSPSASEGSETPANSHSPPSGASPPEPPSTSTPGPAGSDPSTNQGPSPTGPASLPEPSPTQPPSPVDAGTPSSPDASVDTPGNEPPVASPSPSDSPSNAASSRFTAHPIGSGDANLGYWEYLPPSYPENPAPLMVFTHGAAWTGDGSESALQELLDVGPPNLIANDAWPNERPFIVLAPQNPGPGCFDPADIDAFIRYAIEHYSIDTQRVYLTGQSCGAIGAWGYLAEHLDETVVAAVLISGDGNDAFASAGCDLGRVALWGFHNAGDTTVPASGTIDPFTALLACDPTPDVKLTIYPDETAHDAWTKTYDLSAGHDIYTWLLEHERP